MKKRVLVSLLCICLALTCGCSASRANEDKLPPYAAELETCFAETKDVVFEKIGVTDEMFDSNPLGLYCSKTTVPFHGVDFTLMLDFFPDSGIENLPKACLLGCRYVAFLPIGEEEKAVEIAQTIVKDFLKIYGPSLDYWTGRITQSENPVEDLKNGQALVEYWDTTNESTPEGLDGETRVYVRKENEYDENGKELQTYHLRIEVLFRIGKVLSKP